MDIFDEMFNDGIISKLLYFGLIQITVWIQEFFKTISPITNTWSCLALEKLDDPRVLFSEHVCTSNDSRSSSNVVGNGMAYLVFMHP